MGQLAPGPSVPLLPELARVPGHVIWRAAARVQQGVDESLPPGVDLHQYAVLLALGDGEARSLRWLADAIWVSKTTMTKVATELTAAGLTERVRNPADRRSLLLSRTSQGAATVEAWRAHAEAVEAALGEGLTPEERDELRTLVRLAVEPQLAAEAPAELRGSTGFLIGRLHAQLHAEGMDAVREIGLEPRFMGTLVVLRKLGPITQAELARQLGISEPSAMQIAESMQQRGLVLRQRSAVDRRNYDLLTTEHADEIAPDARERLHAVTDAHLAALTASQRARLLALLVRFVNGG